MLDPDPDEINADPQPWINLLMFRNMHGKFGMNLDSRQALI
jgi:hypothetical protein